MPNRDEIAKMLRLSILEQAPRNSFIDWGRLALTAEREFLRRYDAAALAEHTAGTASETATLGTPRLKVGQPKHYAYLEPHSYIKQFQLVYPNGTASKKMSFGNNSDPAHPCVQSRILVLFIRHPNQWFDREKIAELIHMSSSELRPPSTGTILVALQALEKRIPLIKRNTASARLARWQLETTDEVEWY